MKRIPILAAAVAMLMVIGCGGQAPMSKNARMTAGAPMADEAMVAQAEKPAAAKEARAQKGEKKDVQRKIIYTARATLVVDNFDNAEEKLTAAIKKISGAYISNSKINTSPNSPRNGSWTIRVPSEQLDAFFDDIGKLGEVHERSLDSQDVTDQFYDRENRLKNRLARQEALRERLRRSTDKEEAYLAVDRELAKVTEDIEADQGQLQLWSKLSQMATVNLIVRERKDYVPPTSPAFGTTISRTFSGSVDVLVSFGQGIVLVLVALVPWIPVMAVIVLPFYLLIRRALRTPPPRPAVLPVDAPTVLPNG